MALILWHKQSQNSMAHSSHNQKLFISLVTTHSSLAELELIPTYGLPPTRERDVSSLLPRERRPIHVHQLWHQLQQLNTVCLLLVEEKVVVNHEYKMRTKDKFLGRKNSQGLGILLLKDVQLHSRKKGCCSFDHLTEIVIHGALSAVL